MNNASLINSSLKKALNQGFFHIFSTSVLNKIIAMLTNIILVRVLTKDEFGYFSYAYNIVMIIASFSSLGVPNTILQYGCESIDKYVWARKEKTLFVIGCVSNLICSVCTLLYALFIPLSMPEGKYVLAILSFIPIVQFLFSYITMKMRVLEKNKEYAFVTNIQSIAYFVAACLGGYLFSIQGTAIGRYVGNFIPVLIGFHLIKKEFADVKSSTLTCDCKEEIKYSFWVLLNNASSSVFNYFGVLIIGIVVSDAEVLADYRVATQIPTALIAIPMAIATFVYPKFVRNQNNPKWIIRNYHLVQFGLGSINFLILIGSFVLAPWIITIMYGIDYAGAVYPFRILMGSYFVSGTFRTLTGHVLSMLHQVKASFFLGVISCAINIVADFIMVKMYGSVGAAYATLIVVIVESVISTAYLYWFLRKKIMQRN